MKVGKDVNSILEILNEKDFIFGIAIGIESDSFNHCALIYKWKEQLKVIDFYCGVVRSDISYADLHHKDYLIVNFNKSNIPIVFALQIPSLCEAIIEAKQPLNFGLTFNNTTFNNNGLLQLDPKDIGLTCATFILSIFRKISIELIDIKTWEQRDEDKKWQNGILTLLEKNKDKIESNVVTHCSQHIGCYRFRPEEVASSISHHTIPIDFTTCSALGSILIEMVRDGI